ncbi:MAG: 50S ribosomal protein L24 [Methanomassiliicoccaceae archaeon]|nr:50S ribosomal protein L24 [Methanomassiliicoccaceae archaeon]
MTSSKARVQRKVQANAPSHTKRKMLSAHLSDELRAQYGVRTARVCKGDTVAIIRGEEDVRGTEAKVLEVFTNTGRVSVEGVTINQADGTATVRPVHASNLIITKLNTEDQWRIDSLSKNKEGKK